MRHTINHTVIIFLDVQRFQFVLIILRQWRMSFSTNWPGSCSSGCVERFGGMEIWVCVLSAENRKDSCRDHG